MQAMILAFEPPAEFSRRRETGPAYKAYMDPWRIYSEELNEAGVIRGGNALAPPEAATRLKIRNGERIVEDGPFADSKEQLGGYFIVDVADMNEAAAWAKKCPAADSGRADVMPVAQYGSDEQ